MLAFYVFILRQQTALLRPIDSSKLKEIQHYPVEKGGDPAAGSPTATLLRLSPNHGSRFRRRPPEG